jgi:phosphoribosyl 1,2-cyclic phosphate phosphodiesterase
LDEVRAFNFLSGGKPFPIYATERVQQAIRREFAYIFETPSYPGIPKIDIHTISNEAFVVGKTKILPVEVFHHRLPVLGFRIGDFAYITDANRIEEKERAKIRGAKVLVLNALRREAHISHFTLTEALEIIRDLAPEKAYLTHLSHQMGRHADVMAELPDNVAVGFDGMQITV